MKQFVKESSWSWRIITFSVIVIFWLLETLVNGNWLRSQLEKRTLWLSNWGIKSIQIVQTPIHFLIEAKHSSDRIRSLEQEYSQALAQLAELSSLEQENSELRKIIENSDRHANRTMISEPIVSYGTPFLGSGSEDGLEVGNLVFVAQTLVGRIAKVSPYQAEVELLTQQSSPSLLAKTETGIEGVLKAENHVLWLTELPSEANISIGQKIVTSGQINVPGDLFIGKIAALDHDPAAPVQRARVEQVVSFYEAKVVEVNIR